MKKKDVVVLTLMVLAALGFLVYGFFWQEKKTEEIKGRLEQACLAAVNDMPLLNEELEEADLEEMFQNFAEVGTDYCAVVFWTDGFFVKTKGVVSEINPWIYENNGMKVRFFSDPNVTEVYAGDELLSCGSREDICEQLLKEGKLDKLEFFETQESFENIWKETIAAETEKALQNALNDPEFELKLKDICGNFFVAAFVPGQEEKTLAAAKLQAKQTFE